MGGLLGQGQQGPALEVERGRPVLDRLRQEGQSEGAPDRPHLLLGQDQQRHVRQTVRTAGGQSPEQPNPHPVRGHWQKRPEVVRPQAAHHRLRHLFRWSPAGLSQRGQGPAGLGPGLRPLHQVHLRPLRTTHRSSLPQGHPLRHIGQQGRPHQVLGPGYLPTHPRSRLKHPLSQDPGLFLGWRLLGGGWTRWGV